jgi:Holliday junction resolvase
MKEGALVLKIRKALEKEGAYVCKPHGGQYSSGIPDLHATFKGRSFWFEVKMPGREKKVTQLQRENLMKIRKAGGYAGVVSSVTDAKLIMLKGVYRHGI